MRVPVPVQTVAGSRTGMLSVMQQGFRRFPKDAVKPME